MQLEVQVKTCIELLSVFKKIIGRKGIIEIAINDKEHFLIGDINRRIVIADVMAMLEECPKDAKLLDIVYVYNGNYYKCIFN